MAAELVIARSARPEAPRDGRHEFVGIQNGLLGGASEAFDIVKLAQLFVERSEWEMSSFAGVPYDESRHLMALQRRAAPLLKHAARNP